MAESWKNMFVTVPGTKPPVEDAPGENAPQESLCDNPCDSMDMSGITFSDDITSPIPITTDPNRLCSEPSEPILGLGTLAMGDAPSNLFEGCLNYDTPLDGASNRSTNSMWTDHYLSPFHEHRKLSECGTGLTLDTETAETSRCGSAMSRSQSMKHGSSPAGSSSQPSYRIDKKKTTTERERNRRAAAKYVFSSQESNLSFSGPISAATTSFLLSSKNPLLELFKTSLCRQKAKMSQSQLQERERILAQQNRFLIASISELKEEVLHLRHEILKHGGCHSELIDQYIWKVAQRARSD
ncbi:hypothetical protein F5Y13DRAFT_184937 [Hypoxylon sp. FL1857]|nr:hypothetical protein F5Y13DRAFT_184937 [Hypoxylon sp. FL1857]